MARSERKATYMEVLHFVAPDLARGLMEEENLEPQLRLAENLSMRLTA